MDDGSTDSTVRLARDHGADVVISDAHNRGLGAARCTRLAAANELDAKTAFYRDSDGEYPPEPIPDLLGPILQGEADYVLGSRYLGQRVIHLLGKLVFTALLCLAAGRRITDGQTGFRAFSRRALKCAGIIHDYNYAQVLTLDLIKKGMLAAQQAEAAVVNPEVAEAAAQARAATEQALAAAQQAQGPPKARWGRVRQRKSPPRP